MALQLVDFDACDLLRCIYRPESLPYGSKRRKGRRGKGASFSPLGIPEYLCEKFIRPNVDGPHRPVSQGVRHLWAIDGVLQRGLFYWMIMDLIQDFIIEWSSMIERTETCRLQYGGSCYGRSSEGPAIGTGSEWKTVPFQHQEATGAASWNGLAGAHVEGTDVTATGSVVLVPNGPGAPEYAWQARIVGPNGVLATSDVQDGANTDPNLGLVFKPKQSLGGLFFMELRVVAGLFESMLLKSANLSVSSGGLPPWQLPNINSFLCGVPGMLSGN